MSSRQPSSSNILEQKPINQTHQKDRKNFDQVGQIVMTDKSSSQSCKVQSLNSYYDQLMILPEQPKLQQPQLQQPKIQQPKGQQPKYTYSVKSSQQNKQLKPVYPSQIYTQQPKQQTKNKINSKIVFNQNNNNIAFQHYQKKLLQKSHDNKRVDQLSLQVQNMKQQMSKIQQLLIAQNIELTKIKQQNHQKDQIIQQYRNAELSNVRQNQNKTENNNKLSSNSIIFDDDQEQDNQKEKEFQHQIQHNNKQVSLQKTPNFYKEQNKSTEISDQQLNLKQTNIQSKVGERQEKDVNACRVM